jgi:hypothetical protein
MGSYGVILVVVTTRSYGAGLVAVLVLAAGCGGTRHAAARVEVSASAGTSSTESTTTLPETNAMPRLQKPVTLDDGQWYLAPPRPTDTTSLTDAVAGDAVSHNADGSLAKPIVFLARYTDELPKIAKLPTGSYAPVPQDQLVVVVLRYGTNPIAPQGPVPMTGPMPTGLSSFVSMDWLIDPVTGEATYGTSYPGPLPPISTTPATG